MHLDKYFSKVSMHFELDRICKSITYFKIRSELGFGRSFLNRTQNRINSDHDQELHRLAIRSEASLILWDSNVIQLLVPGG
jgi:hypothetical protein